MKKIINKITVLALIVSVFTSCDSELDQVPFDEFGTENAYVTAADFENAVRGVYATLTSPSFYGGSDAGGMLDAPDVLSDNVTFAQRGRGTRRTLHNWQYGASDEPMGGLYERAYQLIYRANVLLSKSENFEGENKANVVAEAKALRALAHFDMITFFGKIPTQSGDANGSLGIAYMTEPEPLEEPKRETVGFVYDQLVIDLTDAAANINESNGPGRLSKDAINILLSRVYLYMGKWQNAIDAANRVTTAIAPRTDVVGVWEDENQSGLAFYIPVNPPVLGNTVGVTWSQGGNNNLIPEYVVSYELYNLFAEDDIRKEAYTFQATNDNDNLAFNAIKKLYKRPGGAPGLVDIKIFRAAEAALNKAEALYNLGQEGPARTALDAVRTKRYTTPPSGETGTALRDAIRLERRLEFAFEYQRFFDLKRWGLPVDRESFGDLADGSGTPSDQLSLPASSNKFQLPIPQTAMDLNPNLVQNPGY
ncbi:RagB/SusD family nutrient uptake outer membrane protein [Aequorivita sp. F47161]|uniref:RagB/SusD family nutrient uptake outer membrane protein n=1 Tax=Aequorivita vitellina TaxID=2874475 RepID=A0A9X1QUA5_9FLAO|nr:RagB/SusD family nutrient uptake outer membrane protein [Aequorivita vitellina]MCG2418455.1 RagB/SusD family nutrient uptake outer membrane protein [Aequorivita vitellina]